MQDFEMNPAFLFVHKLQKGCFKAKMNYIIQKLSKALRNCKSFMLLFCRIFCIMWTYGKLLPQFP